MHIVNAMQTGCVAQVVQQMAEVMQQSGRHQRITGTLLFTPESGLQRMLQHGDRLAGVLLMAFLFKQFFNVV
jgi:ParB-like chromosome segregation protein Spo0J